MSLYSKDIDYVPFRSTRDERETLEPKRGGEKCRFMNQSWVLELQVVSEGSGRPGEVRESSGDHASSISTCIPYI